MSRNSLANVRLLLSRRQALRKEKVKYGSISVLSLLQVVDLSMDAGYTYFDKHVSRNLNFFRKGVRTLSGQSLTL